MSSTGGGKGRTKSIILDKAPQGDNVSMSVNLEYHTFADLQPLADALNAEFGTTIMAADLAPLATVGDVWNYVESLIGGQ